MFEARDRHGPPRKFMNMTQSAARSPSMVMKKFN